MICEYQTPEPATLGGPASAMLVVVLDAKFKLEWIDGAEDDVERATVKLDDVYKMHAYRDAIEAARSAWVLYPGTERHAFSPAGDATTLEGVGAVPLRPEEGGEGALRVLLTEMLTVTDVAPLPSPNPPPQSD